MDLTQCQAQVYPCKVVCHRMSGMEQELQEGATYEAVGYRQYPGGDVELHVYNPRVREAYWYKADRFHPHWRSGEQMRDEREAAARKQHYAEDTQAGMF